ncbi:MAG TPA: hypothetical protein VGU46_04455 [Acidobacteriaceae bacterium]|nr:hypothetical protein [Acidobacteriaceae bacterium]
MRFPPSLGGDKGSAKQAAAAHDALSNAVPAEALTPEDSHLLRTVGWVSAALGAVALGLIVGRELRQRYKFNRRTPYDLYAHSGDELRDMDFGVGI